MSAPAMFPAPRNPTTFVSTLMGCLARSFCPVLSSIDSNGGSGQRERFVDSAFDDGSHAAAFVSDIGGESIETCTQRRASCERRIFAKCGSPSHSECGDAGCARQADVPLGESDRRAVGDLSEHLFTKSARYRERACLGGDLHGIARNAVGEHVTDCFGGAQPSGAPS